MIATEENYFKVNSGLKITQTLARYPLLKGLWASIAPPLVPIAIDKFQLVRRWD